MRFTTIIIIFIFVASCSSVNKDFSFSSTDAEALVVLAVDGLSGSNQDFYFRQVDLTTKDFLSIGQDHSLSNALGLTGNELIPPNASEAKLRYTARKAAPGDYAFIFYKEITNYGTSSSELVYCNAENAPVYNIKKGSVNVIRLTGALPHNNNDKSHLTTVVNTLENYPNINAEIINTPVVSEIKFKVGKSFLSGDRCKSGTNFEVIESKAFPNLTE